MDALYHFTSNLAAPDPTPDSVLTLKSGFAHKPVLLPYYLNNVEPGS